MLLKLGSLLLVSSSNRSVWWIVLFLASCTMLFFVLLRVLIRCWRVRVFPRIPPTSPEDPPAHHRCEDNGHVDSILCSDVVRGWVAALHSFRGVKNCGGHDSPTPISSLALGKDELYGFTHRDETARYIK